MTKWEYCIEPCNAGTLSRCLEICGLNGWEAWHMEGTVAPDGKGGHIFGTRVYFKRPLLTG